MSSWQLSSASCLSPVIFLVFAALDGIYKAALYNYAVDGAVPILFPEDAIRGAFRRE